MSAGGCGDSNSFKPGTLGALLLGDLRLAEEAAAAPAPSSELPESPLGLEGDDLNWETFRFFLQILIFGLFTTIFSGDGALSILTSVFFVPLGSLRTVQEDIFRRELSLLTFRFLFLKNAYFMSGDDTLQCNMITLTH